MVIGMAGNCYAKVPKGYNTEIPECVLTPDTVETRLGTLNFFDGIPNEKAAAALFANLDLNRGLQALLNGMPASNFEAGRAGHIALGQKKANQVIIFDGLMDSNSLFLTGNAGTVYITTFLDLKRDGPTVTARERPFAFHVHESVQTQLAALMPPLLANSALRDR